MNLRRKYGLGMAPSPRVGIGRSAGGGGGGGPVNLVAPEITGLLTQGSDLTFDVGLWSGTVDTFEIEVTQTSPAETLLARQTVTGTTTGTVDADVGGSLTLNVWATGPGGTTLASSAAFGPIEPAGDQWIIGLVLNDNAGHNPTPSGSPVTYTRLGPFVEAGMAYSSGQGWGWVGTATTSDNVAAQTRADVRLAGRANINHSPDQAGIRVDVPGPGVYILHMGFGATTGVTPTLVVRDGPNGAAALLTTINVGLVSTGSSGNTMDAAGNVTTHALWAAASQYGGVPIEVTVTGSSLWLGRPVTGNAIGLNCVSILKKAA